MVVQTATGVMHPFAGKDWIETWQISFSIAASAAAGTLVNGTVTRVAGGISVSTSSLPFYIPPSQSGTILDIYVSGAPAVDGLFNLRINDIDQRLAIVLSAYNAQIAGRKAIVARALPAGSQVTPQLTTLVANGSTAVTDNVFADVHIFQA
jgi:hypothetical protein